LSKFEHETVLASLPTPRRRSRWLLSLGFALIAVALAVLRWTQCTVELSGGALHLRQFHSVEWNPATCQIRRTGDDPYLWVEVPAEIIPLRSVTIEFSGRFAPEAGRFYIYEYPVYLPGETVDEQHVTPGVIRSTPHGIVVHWRLTDSKMIRLDLPDNLDAPLKMERLVLKTNFAANDRWTFILMLVALGVAATIAFLPTLAALVEKRPALEWVVIVLLIMIKVGLAADIQLRFIANAAHDDALFIGQAISIMDGKWLGAFGPLTLSKGPTFPLFLAFLGKTGLPLQATQAVLHAVACVAFDGVKHSLLSNWGLRLLLFSVLLFDPQTLSAAAMGRVLRSGIQPALTLPTLAGVIGLCVQSDRSLRRMIAWGALAGIAGAGFWYSREEGIWLVPSIALVLGAGAVAIWRRGRSARWRLPVLALPIGVVLIGAVTLRITNARFYGAPIAVDVKDGGFPRAYGALVRITPQEKIPGVPVPREVRLRAYAVSPAFAELRPLLEGRVGEAWSQFGWGGMTEPFVRKEIRGGWFQWALREAAADTGRYQTAATASDFWNRVADEINAACDAHRIAAGPPRNGFIPRWDPALLAPLFTSLRGAVERTVQMTDFYAQPEPSSGTARELAPFARVTHAKGMTEITPPGFRTEARIIIYRLYRACGGIASVAAIAATVLLAGFAVKRRAIPFELTILLALIGGALALMLIVALVDVTSFSALHAIYLAPATPLALGAWVLAPAWAGKFCFIRRDGKNLDDRSHSRRTSAT